MKTKRIEKGQYEVVVSNREFIVCRSGADYDGSEWNVYEQNVSDWDGYHNTFVSKREALKYLKERVSQ